MGNDVSLIHFHSNSWDLVRQPKQTRSADRNENGSGDVWIEGGGGRKRASASAQSRG